MEKIYYNPSAYWRGNAAVHKLAKAAKVKPSVAKAWLEKQPIWQIFRSPPKRVVRPRMDIRTPNEIHQADLLFLPHDKIGRKTYKYALTVIDIASRYKDAEPLTSKKTTEVAAAFKKIYSRVLTWPNQLQVDPGREFMGEVTQLMKRHNTTIRRSPAQAHRDQLFVESFNRVLAQRLFIPQYDKELEDPSRRNREWVKNLQTVIADMNSVLTAGIGVKPNDAIKRKSVISKQRSHQRETRLPIGTKVRYLYLPGELEGGTKRATDPIWSVTTHWVMRSTKKPGDPIYYHISDVKRAFTRPELQVVVT